jgi:hypothetical protein
MNRKSLIFLVILGLIVLAATTQAIRPTFKGSPAACAWYTDTSRSNPYSEGYNPNTATAPGYIGRDPSVYDTLDAFVRNQDHKLLHYHLVPNRDYGGRLDGYIETVLPDIVTCYSSPAVVQTGPHTIHVFVWSAEERRTTGIQPRLFYHVFLWHLTWNGNQWSSDRIEVSNRDTSSTLEAMERSNLEWGIEDAIPAIAVSSWGADRIDLFIPGIRILHLALISGQPMGQWEDIGQLGSQTLGIASGSWGPGRIDVIALCGDDRAYYHKSFIEGSSLSDNGRQRVNGWDQDWQLVSQYDSNSGIRFTSAPFINQVPLFPGAGGSQGLGFGGRGVLVTGHQNAIWGRGYHPDGTMSDLNALGGSWMPENSPTTMSKPAAVNYIGDHATLFMRWSDDTLWFLDYDLWCCQANDYGRMYGPVPDLPERVATTRSTSGNISAEGQPSIIQMMKDTNIPGSDYRDFDLKIDDPKLCAQVCTEDSSCIACTYVKPGIQGPNARCWLKNNVSSPVPDQCCQSGVKEIRAILS